LFSLDIVSLGEGFTPPRGIVVPVD